MLYKAELLHLLKKKDGKERAKIVAIVVYEGDVNWLGATIEKSLQTPFGDDKISINTTYELLDDKS